MQEQRLINEQRNPETQPRFLVAFLYYKKAVAISNFRWYFCMNLQAETVISSASERQPEMRESGEHSFGFRSLSERSELAKKVDKKRRRRNSRTGFVSGGRKTVLP